MKKVLLLVVCSFLFFGANAQDEPLTGEKGQLILPEAGDIGLGVNMIPFFNWFGNSFNNNSIISTLIRKRDSTNHSLVFFPN